MNTQSGFPIVGEVEVSAKAERRRFTARVQAGRSSRKPMAVRVRANSGASPQALRVCTPRRHLAAEDGRAR